MPNETKISGSWINNGDYTIRIKKVKVDVNVDFAGDAKRIFDALRATIPAGTFDELREMMLESKAALQSFK